MFTMEQVRGMVFACINQSTAIKRVKIAERKLVNLHNSTVQLGEMDNQLRHEATTMNKYLGDRMAKWKDEVAATQRANEKVQSDHKMRLNANGETLLKHREMIDENKHLLTTNQDLINKIGSKLERSRDSLSNEITQTRDELQSKIDSNDKFYID